MGVDIIDYTLLQKKGLIKTEPIEVEPDVLDLRAPVEVPQSINADVQSSGGMMDFLDNTASTPYQSPSLPAETQHGNSDIKTQIDNISESIRNLELKLERIEALLRRY